MSRHHYPFYMVPYPGLIREVNVDGLTEHGCFSVARRVDKAFSEKDIKIMPDGTGIVRADSSLREETFERVPNLSVTMLRNTFPIESAKYNLTMRPETDDWKGGLVKPCQYKDKAFIKDNCYLMVYLNENLHGQPVDYQRKFETLEDAKAVEEYYEDLKNEIVAKTFSTKKLYKAVGMILLKHSPTMLNYWHFELKLQKGEGGFIENTKYKPNEVPSKMNMKQSFVDYVLENYLFKMFWVDKNPCKQDIPYNCFYDNDVCGLKRMIARVWNQCVFAIVPITI